MSFRKIIRRFLSLLPWRAGEDPMLSAFEMRRLLGRERARAKRTKLEFSLLTFMLPDGEERRKVLSRLTAALHGRVRSIDSVGWLDESRIAVLLPGISLPGARRLGRETIDQLSAQGGAVSCKVSQPWAGVECDEGGIQLPDWEPVVGGLDSPEVFDEKGAQVLGWAPTLSDPDSPVVADQRLQADISPSLPRRM